MAQGDDARNRRTAAQRHAQHGRPTPHPAAQDHLPRLHPPRDRSAGGRARAPRPEHRQECGRRGFGRFRRAGLMRAAAAGDRWFARSAAGGPRQAVPVVQRDDRWRGPRIRRRRSGPVVDGIDHVRDGDGRRAGQEPDRRHRHDIDSRPTSTGRSSPTTSSASSSSCWRWQATRPPATRSPME